MKLAWLEDFIALVDTGSFSRAADRRRVSQPAFSRRIRMLEAWFGLNLIHRGPHRLQLTRTARRYEPALRRLALRFSELRTQMRTDAEAEEHIALCTQHTLMVTFLPQLLHRVRTASPETGFRLRAGNRDECLSLLRSGEADLMLCFETEENALADLLPESRRLILGREVLVPVTALNATGSPLFDPVVDRGIKLLGYPEDSFMGQALRTYPLRTVARTYRVETVCESAFTVGLKEMALAGMGIAWLPRALVAREMEQGRLTNLAPLLPELALTIAIHRLGSDRSERMAAIWSLLESRVPGG